MKRSIIFLFLLFCFSLSSNAYTYEKVCPKCEIAIDNNTGDTGTSGMLLRGSNFQKSTDEGLTWTYPPTLFFPPTIDFTMMFCKHDNFGGLSVRIGEEAYLWFKHGDYFKYRLVDVSSDNPKKELEFKNNDGEDVRFQVTTDNSKESDITLYYKKNMYKFKISKSDYDKLDSMIRFLRDAGYNKQFFKELMTDEDIYDYYDFFDF